MRRPAAIRSTSARCSPAELRPTYLLRSRTQCSVGRLDSTSRRGDWWSWSRSCRAGSTTSLLDAVMPGWDCRRRGARTHRSCSKSTANVRFRHELARHAVESSIPYAARRRLHAEVLAALLAADADPVRHRAPCRGGRRRRCRGRLRARLPPAERQRSSRGARRTRTIAVPRRSSIGAPVPSRPRCSRNSATAAYLVNRIDESFEPIDEAIEIYRTLGTDEAMGRCMRLRSRFHWFAGDGASASMRQRGGGHRNPRAARRIRRACTRIQRDVAAGNAGERCDHALVWGDKRSRPRDATRASNRFVATPSATSARPRCWWIPTTSRRCSKRTKSRTLPASIRGNAGVHQHRLYVDVLGAPRAAGCGTPSGRSNYAQDHEVHNLYSYAADHHRLAAICALVSGPKPNADSRRDRQHHRHSAAAAGTVLTELAVRRGDADAAERLADLAQTRRNRR